MTFDDWVKDILKIEAREITHLTPEEQKKVYFTVSADDLIKLWNAGVENGVSGMQLKITELEEQVEKMKCCNNCKHRYFMDWKSVCGFDLSEIKNIENPVTCKCNKWEIKENE